MPTLYYVHDPMCSWCWGFAPTLKKLIDALPEEIALQRVLGGLAKDSDVPMPSDMQTMLQDTWQRIEAKIPGIHFNFDFWTVCQPRRATYNACRAVLAARQQGIQFDEQMTEAIQSAYYQQARNPSDIDTLIELATEIGVDCVGFKRDMLSENVQQQLEKEITLARELFVEGFPALVLQVNTSYFSVSINYNQVEPMLALINELNN